MKVTTSSNSLQSQLQQKAGRDKKWGGAVVNNFPQVQERGLCCEKGDGKQQLWSVNLTADIKHLHSKYVFFTGYVKDRMSELLVVFDAGKDNTTVSVPDHLSSAFVLPDKNTAINEKQTRFAI